MQLAAQGGIWAGPAVVFDRGLPIGLAAPPGTTIWCNCDGNGTASDAAVTGGAEVRGFLDGPLDFAVRLGAGHAAGRFISDPYSDAVVDTGGQNRFTLDAAAWYLTNDFFVLANLGDHLSIEAGPSITYRIAGTFTQDEQVVAPGERVFPTTGTRLRTIATGDYLGGAALRATLLAGVSYRIPLSPSTALVPMVHARIDPDGLGVGHDVNALGFSAGIALLFTGPPPETPPIARVRPQPLPADTTPAGPDPARTQLPPASPPAADSAATIATIRRSDTARSASLEIYALDSAGLRSDVFTVRRRLKRYHQIAPLVPIVVFARASAQLPPRYMRRAPGSTMRFTSDSLSRLDPYGLQFQVLNALALRMRASPAALVAVAGSRTASEPAALARRRAAAVRDYLTGTWGIDSSRISVRANSKAGSVPGALLSSASPALLAPVTTNWEEEVADAPQIGLSPLIGSGVALRSWNITVRRHGNEVSRYSSDPDFNAPDLDISLVDTAGTIAGAPAPLEAELVVEDSSGERLSAHAMLPVAIDRDHVIDGGVFHRYGLVAGSADLAADERMVLDTAVALLRSGDEIIVEYYAGNTGAAGIADRLAASLRARKCTVQMSRRDPADEQETGGRDIISKMVVLTVASRQNAATH